MLFFLLKFINFSGLGGAEKLNRVGLLCLGLQFIIQLLYLILEIREEFYEFFSLLLILHCIIINPLHLYFGNFEVYFNLAQFAFKSTVGLSGGVEFRFRY